MKTSELKDLGLNQEQIDAVYNGTKVPTMGDGE